LTLPLTGETTGLIDEDQLHNMKRSSFLINVARGQIVNETSLKKALTEGWIAGAGLDTWYAYPPDKNTPSKEGIHLLPNVIATPHISSATDGSVRRTFELVAENLVNFSKKEKILNVVDPDLGY